MRYLNLNNKYFSTAILTLIFVLYSGVSFSSETKEWRIEKPLVVMKGIETKLEIELPEDINSIIISVNGKEESLKVIDGMAYFPLIIDQEAVLLIESQYGSIQLSIDPIPIWFSVIPPLIAILFALFFKEVFTALFMGLFIGTVTIYSYYGLGFFAAIFKGFLTIIDAYVIRALNNTGHISIIVFSLLIGGMVHIITKNGGMLGVVNYLSKYAKTKKSGQFITWLLGIAIFFDDYANTLVVGNTMRPVTDRLKISREKLAYLVDSTAAPIASIALITTWVGAELSYIQDGIKFLNLDETPYLIFIHSLKYAFYPIFTLGFILMLIFSGRDFGPMYKVENKVDVKPLSLKKEVVEDKEFAPKEGVKPRAFNALIPVLVVVLGTMAGLFYTGIEAVPWDSDLSFSRNLSQV
ncbi:MAG: hypothetical protein KAH25_07215, partial [Bacteroidales bacterium]|nr:hypothetical protein [Bacteroidales bacterium]